MFKDVEEFCKQVDIGQEFSFVYNGTEFELSQNEKGIYIINCKTGQEHSFTSTKEILDSFKIEDQWFKDIITELQE